MLGCLSLRTERKLRKTSSAAASAASEAESMGLEEEGRVRSHSKSPGAGGGSGLRVRRESMRNPPNTLSSTVNRRQLPTPGKEQKSREEPSLPWGTGAALRASVSLKVQHETQKKPSNSANYKSKRVEKDIMPT